MYRRFVKRLLDILVSILSLPILLLLFLVVAPCILIEDFGSIFYMAERLGKNGKTFRMFKFRSMKVNAPDIRNADGTTFNASDDPRVTKVGRILRRTSLDEVPQMINVLKGDMSFIGPRPDLPDAIELYSEKDRKKLEVLPGITGYSQAYYRNSSTLEERFLWDVYYVENLSFGLDAKILVQTIAVVVTGKNVYRNGEY